MLTFPKIGISVFITTLSKFISVIVRIRMREADLEMNRKNAGSSFTSKFRSSHGIS